MSNNSKEIDVVALAQSVTIEQTTYAAGTDHTELPAAVADRIRNPSAWVGGVAPALSVAAPAGKPRLDEKDLSSAVRARTALGLGSGALRDAGVSGGLATLGATAELPVGQMPAGWDASPRLAPLWVQPSTILTTLQASHGWTNNAGSTLATDSTDFTLGTQSVKITTGGAGAQANLSKTGMTSFDATGKALRIRVKVTDLTHMAELGCFLGSSSFANYYKWSIQVTGGSKFLQSGDWAIITLSFHDAQTAGTPVRSALTDARLYVIDDNTGVPVVVNWQSFELIPDGSATWPNGVVSICFDDVYASQWTQAKPVLDAKGWPASCYSITDYLDTAGRLTAAQLMTAQDQYGWEIGGHASTGANHSTSYTGLSAAALEADIRAQRAKLLARGLRGADGTAYPLGQFGLTTDGQSTTDIVRAHWAYARTTASRTKETLRPADRWRLRAISGISTFAGGVTPTSLTTATTGEIAKCLANKSWLILVFHDITAGAPAATTQCSLTDFTSIVTAISAAGIPVRTVGEVLRSMS